MSHREIKTKKILKQVKTHWGEKESSNESRRGREQNGGRGSMWRSKAQNLLEMMEDMKCQAQGVQGGLEKYIDTSYRTAKD